MPNIKVNLENININMVFFSIENINYNEEDIVNKFYNKGIKLMVKKMVSLDLLHTIGLKRKYFIYSRNHENLSFNKLI